MMPRFGNDDFSSGPDECACAPVFAVSNATGPYNYCAQSDENCANCGYTWCPGRKHVDDIEPTTTEGDDVSLVGGGGGGGGGGGDLEYHGPLPKVKLPIVKLPPLAITSTVTTGGAPAAPASEPTVTVALPTPVAPEGPPASVAEPPASEPAAAPAPGSTPVAQEPAPAREEPATPASEPAAEPAPGPTPGAANSTEETDAPP